MAKIILLPDEQFEHSHNVESESKLINGIVKFTIDGSTIKLKVGDAIKIPANKLHCIHNIGQTEAIIDCLHYPPSN